MVRINYFSPGKKKKLTMSLSSFLTKVDRKDKKKRIRVALLSSVALTGLECSARSVGGV